MAVEKSVEIVVVSYAMYVLPPDQDICLGFGMSRGTPPW